MYGVGKKIVEKLKGFGIYMIGELVVVDEYLLKCLFGINGLCFKNKVNGIYYVLVDLECIYEFKSVGNLLIFLYDFSDEEELLGVFRKFVVFVSDCLQCKEVMVLKLFIMIRYVDWKIIIRSIMLKNLID